MTDGILCTSVLKNGVVQGGELSGLRGNPKDFMRWQQETLQRLHNRWEEAFKKLDYKVYTNKDKIELF